MSMLFTVVARTTGGWRSPPTIPAMTFEQARTRCRNLRERFPHQEFDILGVIDAEAYEGRLTESREPVSLDAWRMKTPSGARHAAVTALQR